MAEKDPDRKPLPPYIPFKTFLNLLRKLKDSTVPDQIDLSVLRSYSNSMARQVVASLKYMKVIDAFGKTSDLLRTLVTAYDSHTWRDVWLETLFEIYDPLLNGLSLETATPRQLEEKFRAAGADGQMLQKCVAFFVAGATEAGAMVSPHILNKPRKPRAGKGRGRPRKTADDAAQDEIRTDGPSVPTVTGNLVKFQFPIPEKGNATILIPNNVASDDWEMISTMMKAYVSRLEKK
jgi:hypothetical protein